METVQSIPSRHREFISDTAFDYYGKRLVSASADGCLKIWNLVNKEWTPQEEIKGHSSLISRVDWAHPIFGQIFAACFHNDKVAIYQEVVNDDQEQYDSNQHKTWKQCCIISEFRSPPLDIAFCPHFHGLCLAIGCRDCIYICKPNNVFQLQVWSMDYMIPINKPVNCLSWCKSRGCPPSLIIGTDEGAQIFKQTDSHTWEPGVKLPEYNGIIQSVAWSNNVGKEYETIAIACSDGRIRIYELTDSLHTCDRVVCLEEFGKEIWRIGWNLTGTILASSGDDNCVRMWKKDLNNSWQCINEIHSDQ